MENPTPQDWIEAMVDRLRDGLTNDYDYETQDLIVLAFRTGLLHRPDLLNELKSSSLIESDYFEDEE